MKYLKRKFILTVMLLVFTGLSASVGGGITSTAKWRRTWGWDWQLSNARYQKLDVFQRAQYNKSAALFAAEKYKAAAGEFDKFRIQFPDSNAISYILFMKGLSLHQAKTRNSAIKVYNEVLDFFADEVDDAAPAMYFMAVANLDNGDVSKGLRILKQMIANAEYRKHQLAAGALGQLASASWTDGDYTTAVTMWKQLVADFSLKAGPVINAKRSVTSYYVHGRNFSAYENWLVNDENREDAKHRVKVVTDACQITFEEFDQTWRFPDRKFETKDFSTLLAYLDSRKSLFEKNDTPWLYYSRALDLLARMLKDRKATDGMVTEMVAYLKKNNSDDNSESTDKKLAWMTDCLWKGGDYTQSKRCVALIKNRHLATFKEHEIIGSGMGDWPGAVKKLLQLEKMNDAKWIAQAQSARAKILMDRLKKYSDAIKLFRQINNPPRTLWDIQYCYRRSGKITEAISTLREIENFFPDDAPNAAWQITQYQHETGNSKKAIASARRVLKVYPKSQASSRAHQLLEKYGIATGGGLIE